MDANATQIELMLDQAIGRMHDASILSRNITRQGDSNYLLELLAFELLLKCVATIHGDTDLRRYQHKYTEIYKLLPAEVRNRIETNAQERMNTTANYSDMEALLNLFSKNFIDLRYPYEKYREMTREEYRERGSSWTRNGMPEDQADFLYKPNELFGLLEALKTETENWLAKY